MEELNKEIERVKMVGVRGKIECENGKINLIAEKISFLSSRKESE